MKNLKSVLINNIMWFKSKTSEDLILELGVILDQIKVNKKGLKDHPDNEQFKKAIPYMINEGKKIKNELEKRISNEKQ